MKKYLLITIAILPLFLFMSCPPEKNEPIELEIYETYCTSIKLKITMLDSVNGKEYTIKRNDSTIINGWMIDNEEIVTDENLEPNTQYTYKAYSKNDESEIVTATTMDTTSHDFTWTIDTLGIYASSLRDVAIIDENNIWAVGEIVTDTANYNAAHWNGEEWELIKILSGNSAVSAIIYFNEDDMWVSIGSFPVNWNGNEWTLFHLHNMGIDADICQSIWGSSSEDIYFVGNSGSIVHYDGNNFEKMESGTKVQLDDVSGNDNNVFAAGYENMGDNAGKSVALVYENNEWQTIKYEDHFYPNNSREWGLISTVWAKRNKAYIMTYSGLREYYSGKIIATLSQLGNSRYHIDDITGNDLNDYFLLHGLAGFIHYNGYSWHQYNEISNQYTIRSYKADFKNNTIVAVGYMGSLIHAVIITGKRNN